MLFEVVCPDWFSFIMRCLDSLISNVWSLQSSSNVSHSFYRSLCFKSRISQLEDWTSTQHSWAVVESSVSFHENRYISSIAGEVHLHDRFDKIVICYCYCQETQYVDGNSSLLVFLFTLVIRAMELSRQQLKRSYILQI